MTANTTTQKFDHVDASTVEIEANVRTDVKLDPAFLDSIKEFGILTPVFGRRDSAGTIHVRAGQRRTQAARELGVPLPVVYFDSDDQSEEPAWMRAALQLIENDQRSTLNDAERVAAWHQMSLDGLSDSKLAKIVGKPKEIVKAGLAVALSPTAMNTAAEYDIDLLQLATIAEFDEHPDIAESLVKTAINYPYDFDHAVARARRTALHATLSKELTDKLVAEGKTVFSADEYNAQEVYSIERLQRDEESDVEFVEGAHEGYAIKISYYNDQVEAVPVVKDLAAYGYKLPSWMTSGGGTETRTGPMTDEQKAERRHIIACNRAWLAGEPVRREWVKSFLSRKTLPRDGGTVIAVALTRHAYAVNNVDDSNAHDFLGIERAMGGREANALAHRVEAQPNSAGLVTLALILGKLEGTTGKNTWRNPTPEARFYLNTLRDWGYNLSDVEQIAIGERTELQDEAALSAGADLEAEDEDLAA